MSSTITKIQVEGNNVVSFLSGTNYIISMSQVMPSVPTYISYSNDSITISQDGIKSFQFTIYTVTEVGGNTFTALNFNNTTDEVRARTIEIYRLLVTSIFKGCCECGNTEPECSIQYTAGSDASVLGTFYDGGGAIRLNYFTANNQDFTGFWPIVQDGSWIFVFSKTDPTVYGVYQLSSYSDGGPGIYAQFNATLLAGPAGFPDGTSLCIDVTSVGGNLVQTWQETLVTGSVLDQNNTIDGGGFDLTFDNNASFVANVPAGSVTANSTGVSIASGGKSVEVTPTYVNIITPNHGTATTGMVLALDASGHVEYVSAGAGSGTVTSIDVDGGTGISVSPAGPITTSGTFTVTNTAPDQTVVLNNGTGISTSGTYPNFTITNTGLINVPGFQSVLTAGSTLSQDNTINGGGFTQVFGNNYKFNIVSEQYTGLQATDGTINSYLDLYPQSNNTKWGYDNGVSDATEIEMTGDKMYVKTPSYATASVGDVLTLQTGGYIEYQTPTGGGGIPFGTASGTDTYTATIGSASSYTDGDAYLVRFTNGNTTGCTLNINSIGARDLYRNNDGLLIGGDIWDGAEMLCVYNSVLNGFDCIGTSPNSLFSYVTNDDSVTITKGQPVYAFSGTGDRMTVKRANNTTDATSAQTVGLVYSDSIAAGQKGIIIIQGLLTGLSTLKPTDGWADGSPVYLGATAGAKTPTKPYAPNHLVYLGVVTTASPGGSGRMYVRVQNGYELDELHNVQAQTPSLNDTLWYDSSVSPGQWKTASIPTILGYTPVPTTRSISTTAPLTGGGDLSADRTLSMPAATGSVNGYLTSSDWTTFNGKQNNVGFTTVGTGVATLANPSAISFIRIKADNTVDTRTPAQVLTDLGVAGTIILNRDFANTYNASTANTNTVLFSVLIPANTLQVNDWITTRTLSKGSTAGGNFLIYINTTATIGGTQIAQWNPSANLSGLFERNFAVGAIGSSGNLKYFNSSMSGISLYSGFNANYVTATIDTTINQYLVFSANPGTSGTSTTYGNLITILR